MLFWIICTALALLLATLFALALLRSDGEAEHPAEYDLRIYRDQLKEVDRDLARGVLTETEATRIRTEVGRRVLAADAQLQKAQTGTDQPQTLTKITAALTGAAILAGGAAIYTWVGSPGQSDLPHAARLAAAEEAYEARPAQDAFLARLPVRTPLQPDPQYADLIDQLRKAVKENPDELQGQIFLAENEARLANYGPAQEAQKAVIRLKGEEVTASDHATLAQMYIEQAQGYVSPEAESALRAALALNNENPVARFFLGQLWIQNDRPDRTFRIWSGLLNEGPEDAPWIAPIRASLEDIAWLAGVDYTLPEPGTVQLSGPTAEDIENAGEMSPEERLEMIQGMVQGLSARLATEGGTPEEWARLISAYGAMGNESRALAIWREAQVIFGDNPDALETVRRGAQRAGVDQ